MSVISSHQVVTIMGRYTGCPTLIWLVKVGVAAEITIDCQGAVLVALVVDHHSNPPKM